MPTNSITNTGPCTFTSESVQFCDAERTKQRRRTRIRTTHLPGRKGQVWWIWIRRELPDINTFHQRPRQGYSDKDSNGHVALANEFCRDRVCTFIGRPFKRPSRRPLIITCGRNIQIGPGKAIAECLIGFRPRVTACSSKYTHDLHLINHCDDGATSSTSSTCSTARTATCSASACSTSCSACSSSACGPCSGRGDSCPNTSNDGSSDSLQGCQEGLCEEKSEEASGMDQEAKDAKETETCGGALDN